MIIKPAITWLTMDNNALFINDTTVVLSTLGENVAIYPLPAPALPVIQTGLDDFTVSVAVAKVGGAADRLARNTLRLVVAGLMRQLASYVQVACKGDMANLILSGFPPQKSVRQPIGVLPAPQNVTLDHGSLSGQLFAKSNPVFGASAYNWRLQPATPGAAPLLMQSTAANFTFTGLTPGVNYTVMVNVIGAAGPSDWSNPASLFAD